MSLCQCYHTSDSDKVLTLFRVPMYYIFMPSSCRMAMRLLRECDAHEEVSQLSFLLWQPCTGDSVDGTCIERLVQNAVSSWSCCYIAEFWLDGTLLLFEFEPSYSLCPDSQLRAYSTGLAYSTGGYGFIVHEDMATELRVVSRWYGCHVRIIHATKLV